MKCEIKHRWNSSVLFSVECGSLREAVVEAAKQKADLRGANLRCADLRDADLRDADLRGADLSDADLTPIRDDVWAVLSSCPAEVPALRAAIAEGRVDGSTYTGDCACLVGTPANARGCEFDEFDELATVKPNAGRPAEQFFLGIAKGDTPATNQFSAIALGWVDEWLANVGKLAVAQRPSESSSGT